LVEEGDVLISTVRPNLNGVARVGPEHHGATASTGFCVLRPAPGKLDSGFAFQWVKSPTFVNDMVSKATGASYPAVSDRIVLESKIPLPPLPEQRRIAAILDQADALRAKRREALAQLDSLTQSIFIEMFGDTATNSRQWDIKSLAEVTKFENGDRSSNYPSGDDIKPTGILFLSTKNIVDDALSLTHQSFISESKFASLSRGKARRNDLLITLRGTLGSCCIFNCEYETAFINAQMMIIRPHQVIDSTYLHGLLTTNQTKLHIAHIGRGAAVPQLTSAQLSELAIPVPPIDLQRAFATRANGVEALKTTHRAALAELDALLASLQHRAFAGQLS
jgi:type I restriction enzyme S subunit